MEPRNPAASLSGIPKMGLLPLAGPRSVPPPNPPDLGPFYFFPARFSRALLRVRRRSRLRSAGAPSAANAEPYRHSSPPSRRLRCSPAGAIPTHSWEDVGGRGLDCCAAGSGFHRMSA
jgi:hypothetical protein